jgi:hypothetical protein
MLTNLKNIFLNASSFLQSNVAPPKTPASQEEELGTINFLKSRKFFIVFTSILIICFFYFTSIGILFLLPNAPEKITGFVTLFSKTIELFTLVVGFYLGVQTILDYKVNSSSSVNYNADVSSQTSVYKEYIESPKEDDYTLEFKEHE